MPSATTNHLRDELKSYGVAQDSVRLFTGSTKPDHQEYLDLISVLRRAPDSPDGVAEAQGRPVLYFVDEIRLTATKAPPDEVINGIRSRLACRGENAYLARIGPGRIQV